MYHRIVAGAIAASGDLHQLYPDFGFDKEGTEEFATQLAERSLVKGRKNCPITVDQVRQDCQPYLSGGVVYEAEAVAKPLADRKVNRSNASGASFQRKIAEGFTYNGKLYQIDDASRQNMAAMATKAKISLDDPTAYEWPEDFAWIATDNTLVEMDAAELIAFVTAVGEYYRGLIMRNRAIKTAALTAADNDALALVNVEAGWPAASNA